MHEKIIKSRQTIYELRLSSREIPVWQGNQIYERIP
jgi:hypothetical protein